MVICIMSIANPSKNLKCRARVFTTNITEDGKILSKSEHNHGPEISKVNAYETVFNMKQKAIVSNHPTSSVVAAAVANASTSTAGQLSSRANLKRMVNRARSGIKKCPTNPTSITDLFIGDDYKNTCKNMPFLCIDSRDLQLKCKERFLIFATQQNLSMLRTCENWYADGTFRTVPDIFYQLYTIHGLKNGRVIPLVYVLVTGKSKPVYVSILRQLCVLEPLLSPSCIMVDYELAFIKAVKKIFPNATIKGCLFHYSQCLWRKIQNVGLQVPYACNGDYALHLKMFYALAFVPISDVIPVYELLIKEPFFVKHDDEVSDLLDYIEQFWIGKLTRRGDRLPSVYDLEMWNHYQTSINENDRTNNRIEGWHNGFNFRVQAAHVSIWKFIDFLREEQGVAEMEMEQIVSGMEPITKRRKYRNHNVRLLNVIKTWGSVDNLEYLRGIAHNLSY